MYQTNRDEVYKYFIYILINHCRIIIHVGITNRCIPRVQSAMQWTRVEGEDCSRSLVTFDNMNCQFKLYWQVRPSIQPRDLQHWTDFVKFIFCILSIPLLLRVAVFIS